MMNELYKISDKNIDQIFKGQDKSDPLVKQAMADMKIAARQELKKGKTFDKMKKANIEEGMSPIRKQMIDNMKAQIEQGKKEGKDTSKVEAELEKAMATESKIKSVRKERKDKIKGSEENLEKLAGKFGQSKIDAAERKMKFYEEGFDLDKVKAAAGVTDDSLDPILKEMIREQELVAKDKKATKVEDASVKTKVRQQETTKAAKAALDSLSEGRQTDVKNMVADITKGGTDNIMSEQEFAEKAKKWFGPDADLSTKKEEIAAGFAELQARNAAIDPEDLERTTTTRDLLSLQERQKKKMEQLGKQPGGKKKAGNIFKKYYEEGMSKQEFLTTILAEQGDISKEDRKAVEAAAMEVEERNLKSKLEGKKPEDLMKGMGDMTLKDLKKKRRVEYAKLDEEQQKQSVDLYKKYYKKGMGVKDFRAAAAAGLKAEGKDPSKMKGVADVASMKVRENELLGDDAQRKKLDMKKKRQEEISNFMKGVVGGGIKRKEGQSHEQAFMAQSAKKYGAGGAKIWEDEEKWKEYQKNNEKAAKKYAEEQREKEGKAKVKGMMKFKGDTAGVLSRKAQKGMQAMKSSKEQEQVASGEAQQLYASQAVQAQRELAGMGGGDFGGAGGGGGGAAHITISLEGGIEGKINSLEGLQVALASV
jgi:hypothetical protein